MKRVEFMDKSREIDYDVIPDCNYKEYIRMLINDLDKILVLIRDENNEIVSALERTNITSDIIDSEFIDIDIIMGNINDKRYDILQTLIGKSKGEEAFQIRRNFLKVVLASQITKYMSNIADSLEANYATMYSLWRIGFLQGILSLIDETNNRHDYSRYLKPLFNSLNRKETIENYRWGPHKTLIEEAKIEAKKLWSDGDPRDHKKMSTHIIDLFKSRYPNIEKLPEWTLERAVKEVGHDFGRVRGAPGYKKKK
jgi:hypothetical protein